MCAIFCLVLLNFVTIHEKESLYIKDTNILFNN